ncbi:hypothetical protein [Paractinoplanes hotanensis]|uniref:Squalene cyclase C-terminal domain-containing protein n=1 Tax=Paractinoplanes hotanensis TaxID=2906497 RepID=A0ABT0XUN8_9ACTN|nr:hypothetical protein [Actinoplanes hotanensis]MCM4077506.1 hypothetical protein [Actinoplanes hotanensis]
MVEQWLLEGDPAVRWRVLRDLTGASPGEVEREQRRVAAEGWGARLLAAQNDDGGWGEGVYSPKWTSTTYTLLRLIWLGLEPGHPAALRGCEQLWEWRARWRSPETCIASILVRITSHFRFCAAGLDDLVTHLLKRQQTDGGWNCRSRDTADLHGSFHTTILALEALSAYDGPVDTSEAAKRGRAFFLRHKLYQSHRTGEVAIAASVRFPAFPEWHFDVLRGLEHFRLAQVRDDRLGDAIGILRGARKRNGRWSTYSPYAGKQWFAIEPPGDSRWNTARALTVLKWWDGSGPVSA